MSLARQSNILRRIQPSITTLRAMYSNEGEAGSIRAGGGSFAKKEKAQEDQYFRKQTEEQLKALKGHLDEEVSHHEEEIKRHQDRIKQLKDKAKKLAK